MNAKTYYDDVIKNVPLWQKQFPGFATKATFASDDLVHLKDSILSLWENGISSVAANVVFEDVWSEGDEVIFEAQLKDLVDHALKSDLHIENNCSLFMGNIGNPNDDDSLKENWCGAGKMLAIGYDGTFYPCVRFIPFSLVNRQSIEIGNADVGLDLNKIRPFINLTLESQSKQECIECPVATGCAWCQGFNYDDAKSSTIYERATHICEMHKARVRANNYYWNKLESKHKLERKNGTI